MDNKIKFRTRYVDIAKGLGMLAVIWAHILTDYTNPSVIICYAFDIPLFFVLAGMMYNSKKYDSFRKLVLRRVKTLLIPYVIFSIASWAIWAIFNIKSGNNLLKPLLQTILAQGSGGFLVHNVPLWFVTCLFVVEMLYYFISKLSDYLNILICFIMAIIGHFMLHNSLNFDFTLLPWNIESAMSAMLFYCIGNLFVKHLKLNFITNFTENNTRKMIVGILIAIIPFTLGALYNGHITLGSNSLGKSTLLLYIVGFIGVAIIISISALLERLKIIGLIEFIGRNSFDFMAVHVPIKGFLIILFGKIIHIDSQTISNSPLLSAIIFFITLIACFVTVMLIEQFKKISIQAINNRKGVVQT